MKKINIITPSVKEGGGMERYITELTSYLSSTYKVDVYCLKYDESVYKGNKHITIHQSKILRFFPRFLKYLAFALKIYFKTKNKHIPNIATARIFNPTVSIVGGTHMAHNNEMGDKNGLYDRIEIFLEKKSYLNAKYIIAHSPLMEKEINDYNLGVEDKIKMLFPPINLHKFHFQSHDKGALREQLKLPQNKYILLIAGTEDKRKGVPNAVKAMKALGDDFFLIIFGKTCKLDLPQNAKHFGVVDNIEQYYAATDVTLVPSIYEPFGLVVAESLATGTPVILSKETGARVLVNDNNSITLENNSPEAITKAVLHTKDKKWQLEHDFAQKSKLTWDEHISEIEKLLDLNPQSSH
ncbi:glycosyltransferase family 4 protein [Fangia hongkongensis]|uniref:glycosyltransferase family 4 protein n=3 Tax=Fangia hongkongensis TaxID=270495 RepID=UPI00037D52FC|nr:glycosyltransferase family 4 protein [Fangia hongkongensis]